MMMTAHESIRTLRRKAPAVLSIGITPATIEDPLSGVRSLVAPFVDQLPRDELVAFGAVVLELFPEMQRELDGAPRLETIALPSSPRRLSRESEQLFRIVSGAAALVQRALELGWGNDRRVRIAVGDLGACDRVTLHTIHQLRLRRHPRLEISARIDRDLFVSLKRGPLAAEGLWDAEATFQRFLADFLRAGDGPPTTIELDLILPALRHRKKPPKRRDGTTRLATIENLVRWGQYEMALDELGAALDGPAQGDTRFSLYKTTGLVHAYLGSFDAARRAYEIARELTEDPVERAEICALCGLLATKRKGEHQIADAILAEGFALLEGREDEAAVLERGWLSNVKALACFSRKKHDEALALCREAYRMLKPIRSSDALHLKVNLVSNMSVVLEEQGRFLEALDMWRRFAHFLSGPGATLFGKIYFYREAGLLLKSGNVDEAETLFRKSFDEARHIHDDFHALYVAFDLGELALARGDKNEAVRWFQESHECALRTAEHARAAIAIQGMDRAMQATGPTDPPRLPTKLGRPFHLMHIPPLGRSMA